MGFDKRSVARVVGVVIALAFPTSSGCSSDSERAAGPVFGHDAAVGPDAAPDSGDSGLDAEDLDSAPTDSDVEDGPQDSGSDAGSDAGPNACDPQNEWDTAVRLPVSTAEDDLLAAITGDELTIVWVDAQGRVHVADRGALSEAFAEIDPLTLSPDYQAMDGVAVSPDGLTIVVGRATHKGFATVTRPSRGAEFGAEADETAFATVNIFAQTMVAEEWVGAPVLSADGATFRYSVYYEDLYSFFYEAGRTDEVWDVGDAVHFGPPFDQSVEVRKLTGASADGRTLFLWEPAASVQLVAGRTGLGEAWTEVIPMPERRGVQPNGDCSRLYFSASGSGGLDLFSAERK